jgi:hypothetical protein
MLLNSERLEYANQIAKLHFGEKMSIVGTEWTLEKRPSQNGVLGECDPRLNKIWYSNEESLIHEVTHAYLWHVARQYASDEDVVTSITNMLLNRKLYMEEKMQAKYEETNKIEYDANGNIIRDSVGKVYKIEGELSFSDQMNPSTMAKKWEYVGLMTKTNYDKWVENFEGAPTLEKETVSVE